MKKPVGANITYCWEDEPEGITHAYVSFGTYNEETDKDTYEVNDTFIFHYFEGETELVNYINAPTSEFRVLSYEVVYGSIDKDNTVDYCICPMEITYRQSDVCDYCREVAFFDDPDYASMMRFVLVNGKWITEEEAEA